MDKATEEYPFSSKMAVRKLQAAGRRQKEKKKNDRKKADSKKTNISNKLEAVEKQQ